MKSFLKGPPQSSYPFIFLCLLAVTIYVMYYNSHYEGSEWRCRLFNFSCKDLEHWELKSGKLRIPPDDYRLINYVRTYHLIAPSYKEYVLTPQPEVDKVWKDPVAKHVLKLLGYKRLGFFIECGANDGQFLSNTLRMEMKYGWSGLLVEADPRPLKRLIERNRKAWIAGVCLSTDLFPSQVEMYRHKTLQAMSFMGEFETSRPRLKSDFETFEAQCFPLFTLLSALGVSVVDYFSMDMEGAELKVLTHFPFEKILIKVLSIEVIPEDADDMKLFMTSKDCQAAQTFEKQPEYAEVNPAQESIVTCKIFNKKGQCSWQKDGKPVGQYLGKYEWAGNPDVGDCSLRVMNAALEYDDGEWECQVTASDFQAQDALTSRPVKLVVRVPPNAPQIEYNGTLIPMGKNVTTAHGARVAVKCASRYGNPPALLKWFVGDDEITGVNQTNKTEDDNPKKWAAVSVLEYTFTKQQNGKIIKCVAVHEAYPTKSRDTQVVLDIEYGPQVQLLGSPEGDLEENKDEVTLKCLADSNPPATIVWRKAGRPEIYSFQETISLKPLLRRHTGSFSCEAKNEIGKSQPITVDIDVKYPPKVTRAGPERVVVAALYNRTVLLCQAEGNPPPAYQWLQKTSTAEETVYVRGAEHMLVIHNVTYEYQGKYFCKASNVISGTERHSQSEPIDLSVMGPPQVLRHAVEREVAVERGSDAALSVTFCSNPGPTKAIWEWGSMKLESGYEMGRFTAEQFEKGPRDNCYEARLRVSRTDSADSRHYYLNIENSKGNDRYSVVLQVRDPVSMATVVAVIIGCLILLVFVVIVIVYAFKAEKWCFSQSGDFKPTDLESEKSDLEAGSDRSSTHGHHPNGKTGFATIPPSEMQFTHQQQKRSTRPPDPILPQDIQIMKQHRNDRSFRGRTYTVDSNLNKKDINYADLQLPKTSNNGSMKKSNRHHHHPTAIPRNIPPNRIDYAEIQFKPRSNEQAEV